MRQEDHPNKATNRLRRERDRFVAFAFAGADVLIELDRDGVVIFAVGALKRLGHSKESLVGGTFEALLPPHGDPHALSFIDGGAAGGTQQERYLELIGADGTPQRARVSGRQIPDMDHHIYLSITLPKPRARPNAGQSLTPSDSFTGTAARHMSEAGVDESQYQLSVVDLVGMDSLGERVGIDSLDAFVVGVIEELGGGPEVDSPVTSLGPERFAVLHDGNRDMAPATAAITKSSRALDPEKRGIDIQHAAIDLAPGGLDASDAVRALVYTMGQLGKGVAVHDVASLQATYKTMMADTVGRMEAFRNLVRDSNFTVVYQPLVNMQNRAVHHYEALVRFDRDDSEASPFDLIKFAEDADIIGSFDLAMTAQVLKALDNASEPRPHVAVNVSARSLCDATFMANLIALLDRHGAVESNVMFEVTESFAIDNLADANDAIQKLRARGRQVCLDDFGVGATNLDYLRALDIDFVKIDGSYVRVLLASPRAQAFLATMVDLCTRLDIDTIAECVEEEAVCRFLVTQRVSIGQGYLFGKPRHGLPSGLPTPSGKRPAPALEGTSTLR